MLQRDLLVQMGCAVNVLTEEIECLERRFSLVQEVLDYLSTLPGDDGHEALGLLTDFQVHYEAFQKTTWQRLTWLSEAVARVDRGRPPTEDLIEAVKTLKGAIDAFDDHLPCSN